MRLTTVHEGWLIRLICLHSLAIGALLLLVPQWAVRFGGWPYGADPSFFVQQGGIFHFVVVVGYLLEYRRSRGVSFLIAAKSIAVVFLMGIWLISDVPWPIPVSGVGDGLMAALVAWVHRRVQAEG